MRPAPFPFCAVRHYADAFGAWNNRMYQQRAGGEWRAKGAMAEAAHISWCRAHICRASSPRGHNEAGCSRCSGGNRAHCARFIAPASLCPREHRPLLEGERHTTFAGVVFSRLFSRLYCDVSSSLPASSRPARPVLRPRQPARLAGHPHATSLQSVDLSGGWPAVRRVPASMGLHFDNMCGFGAAVQARASTPAPARALDPPASTCCCHVHRLPHPPPAAATAAAAAQQPAADQAIGGEDVPKLTRTTL